MIMVYLAEMVLVGGILTASIVAIGISAGLK